LHAGLKFCPVGIQDVGSISRGDNSFHLSFVSFSLWLGDYLQRTSDRLTTRYALRLRCFESMTRFDERAFDLRPTFDRKRRLPSRRVSEPLHVSLFSPTPHFLSPSRDCARYSRAQRFDLSNKPTYEAEMSEKRLPCATTGVLACSLVFDHVFHSVDDRKDEVRRHE